MLEKAIQCGHRARSCRIRRNASLLLSLLLGKFVNFASDFEAVDCDIKNCENEQWFQISSLNRSLKCHQTLANGIISQFLIIAQFSQKYKDPTFM